MATSDHLVLGIEGGGTKTDWVLLDAIGGVLRDGRLPAANLKLISDAELANLLAVLPREATHVGVFLAGCLLDSDRTRLRRLAEAAWPKARVRVGNDRESGFATALGDGDGLVVISGTGAVVHGRRGDRVTKAGGWGHILGDRGGGYDLGRRALREVILRYDIEGSQTPLGTAVLAALGLSELSQLDDWVVQADKMQIAQLAPVVFRAAEADDVDMLRFVEKRAHNLADFTLAVARRLGFEYEPFEVRLLGGLLTKEPFYANLYRKALARWLPDAHVEPCTRSGAFGAAALALPAATAATTASTAHGAELPGEAAHEIATATTEQRHARAGELDKMDAAALVALFIEEEDHVRAALAACAGPLARAVELITAALRAGGRLLYTGAGTSGRLGVLDASEMPPTFGTLPELVQGVIAGGSSALLRSAEAAEDSRESGALALLNRGVGPADVVCGITASGRTPFVLGALAQARTIGAKTLLLSCNPARRPSATPWDVEIDLPTGPEIVTGSTRLKAGTATKVALNILSTCAMIRLGRVRGGAMVDLKATNVKLRDRAIRIVRAALDCDAATARARLEAADWNVREALEA